MNYIGFVGLFNGLVALILGFAIYFRTRSKNPIYQTFAALTISIGLWSSIYAIWTAQTNETLALFFIRLGMIPCYFIPFIFVWFCRTLIDEPAHAKPPKYLLMPVVFTLISYVPWNISSVTQRLEFPYWPVPGPLMSYFIFPIFNFVVAAGIFMLFRAWSQSVGKRRWQMKWISVSMLFMWFGGLSNWFLWFNIPIKPVPNFFVAICLLAMAYAIVRRGLFDVDALDDIFREAKLSAMGVMAASLNHELRNPLYIAKSKIETHLDSIERGAYEDPQKELEKSREIMNSALKQVSRGLGIINNFSNFSKPHKANEKKEKVVISEVFDDVMSYVQDECKYKKIEINKEPINGLSINANRRQLEEILFNLTINACYALKTKKPLSLEGEGSQPASGGGEGARITLNAHKPNGKIIVEIKDNGPGIPKDLQNRIFEPFYTTKGKKGSGLGLYVTKQLVERNNGNIRVNSKPGEGTEFILEFKP